MCLFFSQGRVRLCAWFWAFFSLCVVFSRIRRTRILPALGVSRGRGVLVTIKKICPENLCGIFTAQKACCRTSLDVCEEISKLNPRLREGASSGWVEGSDKMCGDKTLFHIFFSALRDGWGCSGWWSPNFLVAKPPAVAVVVLGFCEGVQRTQQLFGSGGEGGLDGCRYLDGVGPRSEDG